MFSEREKFEPPSRLDNIPEVILIEIFKWISFEDLHRSIQLVCQQWREIVTTHYESPRVLRIDGAMTTSKAVHFLSKHHSRRIFYLKFLGSPSADRIITRLCHDSWPNLKVLSLDWKWTCFDNIRLHVSDLNSIIDGCPKLQRLEVRECFVYGDMNILVEKIQQRRISRLTFQNRYLVINDIEKLYALKNMRVFRVYCHYFSRTDILAGIEEFCSNNNHSLESLGLYVQNKTEVPYVDDLILIHIASCTLLVKLDLVGSLNVSAKGLRMIAGLQKLRYLKLDVLLISSTVFVEFLGHPFVQKLHGLKLFWNRKVSAEELEQLGGCRELRELALTFIDDHSAAPVIRFAVVNAIGHIPRLRKLKLKSLNFDFTSVLSKLRRSSDLFYVKLTQAIRRPSNRTLRKKLEKQLSSDSIFSNFNYECKTNGVELEIILTKNTNVSSVAS